MNFDNDKIESAIDQVVGKTRTERNWKFTLSLLPEWGRAKEGEISTQEMAAVVVARIDKLMNKLPEDAQYDLESIRDEFEMAGEDVEQFDYAMDTLYNWADDYDVWVKTF